MPANESQLDRLARALVGGGLLGSALGSVGLSAEQSSGIAVAALGAVLLVSGAFAYSILYALIGLKTCDEC